MTVYALAQLAIHDRARYARYVARFMAALADHDARLLVADDAPRVVEGDWHGDKIVLLAFADAATFQAWYDSDAYRAIADDRRAAARASVVLVRGLD